MAASEELALRRLRRSQPAPPLLSGYGQRSSVALTAEKEGGHGDEDRERETFATTRRAGSQTFHTGRRPVSRMRLRSNV